MPLASYTGHATTLGRDNFLLWVDYAKVTLAGGHCSFLKGPKRWGGVKP